MSRRLKKECKKTGVFRTSCKLEVFLLSMTHGLPRCLQDCGRRVLSVHSGWKGNCCLLCCHRRQDGECPCFWSVCLSLSLLNETSVHVRAMSVVCLPFWHASDIPVLPHDDAGVGWHRDGAGPHHCCWTGSCWTLLDLKHSCVVMELTLLMPTAQAPSVVRT